MSDSSADFCRSDSGVLACLSNGLKGPWDFIAAIELGAGPVDIGWVEIEGTGNGA